MKTTQKTKSKARSSSRLSPRSARNSRTSRSTRGRGAGAKVSGKAAAPRSRSKHTSHTTTDHEEIRRWAEARGGHPAAVKRTGGKNDTGIIRIDFPDFSGGNSLKEITWDEFFEKFEESKLALVYQKETAGGVRSNFNKLVKRR